MSDQSIATKSEILGSTKSASHLLYLFPFLAIVVAAYFVLILQVGSSQLSKTLDQPLFNLAIGQQQAIQFLVKDVFILAIFALLFCEIVKAAMNETRAFVNHFLSFVVALTCVYCLLSMDGFGTITFLYITLAATFDVVAGAYISGRAKPLHEPDMKFVVKREK